MIAIRRLASSPIGASSLARRSLFSFSSTTKASSAVTVGTNAAGDKTWSFAFAPEDFETHNFEALPAASTPSTKAELLDLYLQMQRIRRLETASDQLYKSKLIRGFCHLSTGQEAIAAGMEAAITHQDSIITAYRCHGFALGRGVPATSIIAELMGRDAGSSKGKGGSMHIFGPEFYGGNGIVGAQVPLGAGVALAHKYRGIKATCFALYGDGAANQGQVFEAYNMAKLWNLPVVFGCENNLYGMGTAANRAAASTKYFTRGDYIPGIKVNGMDVLAVREACRIARDYTIAHGPLVMEYVTYRYGGHSMSDPGTTYRTREEIQNMRSTRDCINGMKNRILEAGIATEEELKALDKSARVEMDKAVEEAKQSPEPRLSVLNEDIYAPGSYNPAEVRGSKPTKACWFFSQGKCAKGDSCLFSHDTSKEVEAPRCVFFSQNKCRKGAACAFSHEVSTGDVSEEARDTSLPTNESLACAICYESPDTFGLLPECSHVFCISCVRKWRNKSDKDDALASSEAIHACPMCRAKCPIVVPSDVFPEDDDQKQDILKDYKDKMAQVTCRYYKRGTNPARKRCPFGDDCLYGHFDTDGNRVAGVLRPTPKRRNRNREPNNNDPVMGVQAMMASIMRHVRTMGVGSRMGNPTMDDIYEIFESIQQRSPDLIRQMMQSAGVGMVDEEEEYEDDWVSEDDYETVD
ncbi:alpha subunit of pyruvate dehydrogenase [Podochytrium sp. JEL0797]|nr:alpha subunit of pyruvate dehydrogenase [Podochytrium sp. JEL0797]